MTNITVTGDMISYYGLAVAKITIHESTHREKFIESLSRDSMIDGDALKDRIARMFELDAEQRAEILDIIDNLITKGN